MLHTLKSFLENMGAGRDDLRGQKNVFPFINIRCTNMLNYADVQTINEREWTVKIRWTIRILRKKRERERERGRDKEHDKKAYVHSAGIWLYLCFLIPFSWGTAPLFFWAPSYTTASLKLASDVPSQDSSESKPGTHKNILFRDIQTDRDAWLSATLRGFIIVETRY